MNDWSKLTTNLFLSCFLLLLDTANPGRFGHFFWWVVSALVGGSFWLILGVGCFRPSRFSHSIGASQIVVRLVW